jgi:exodeoxyribonuclease VII large subunit
MQNSLPQRFYLTQMRFQTSSAALEKALPKYLLQAEMRLKSVLQGWSDNLFLQNIARFSERLSAIEKRLHYCITPLLENSRASYQQASRLLASVSYQNILSRGFALLRDDKGALIGSASMIKSEKNYQLEFHDGSLQIRRAEDKNLPQKKTSKNTKAPKTNFVQESLL